MVGIGGEYSFSEAEKLREKKVQSGSAGKDGQESKNDLFELKKNHFLDSFQVVICDERSKREWTWN